MAHKKIDAFPKNQSPAPEAVTKEQVIEIRNRVADLAAKKPVKTATLLSDWLKRPSKSRSSAKKKAA